MLNEKITAFNNVDLYTKNEKITKWSNFDDPIWIFNSKSSISWNKHPERFKNISSQDFQSMMLSVKQIVHIQYRTRRIKVKTIVAEVSGIKEFAGWLLSRSIPIRRFSDITKSVLTQYREEVIKFKPLKCRNKEKFISESSVACKLKAVLKLHEYRNEIENGLREVPQDYLEIKNPGPKNLKTVALTPEQLNNIVSAAHAQMEIWELTVKELKTFIKAQNLKFYYKVIKLKLNIQCNDAEFNKRKTELTHFLKKVRKPNLKFSSTYSYLIYISNELNQPIEEVAFFILNDKENLYEFGKKRNELRIKINWQNSEMCRKLILLQISCYIIIAISTGMRASELFSIKPSCLTTRVYRGTELCWIKSTLLKTSSKDEGETAYWICGELAKKAVEILEVLHKLIPTITTGKLKQMEIEDSIFRSFFWNSYYLEARRIDATTLKNNLTFFCKSVNIEFSGLHPRQFRASFAKAIVHLTDTPILALQRHFKHVSLLMTDYYVGIDDNHVYSFLKEQKKLSASKIRQILKGECAGPGGIISNKYLKRELSQGNLTVGYLGDTEERLEDIIDEIQEHGILAYKCGEFTTCVYTPEQAKCGEGGPKAHICQPTVCPNSFVLVEDVPFYMARIRDNQIIFEKLPSHQQRGPYGFDLLNKIEADKWVIKPLIHLYVKEFNKLSVQYNLLSENEKENFKRITLKDRIDYESRIIESFNS